MKDFELPLFPCGSRKRSNSAKEGSPLVPTAPQLAELSLLQNTPDSGKLLQLDLQNAHSVQQQSKSGLWRRACCSGPSKSVHKLVNFRDALVSGRFKMVSSKLVVSSQQER